MRQLFLFIVPFLICGAAEAARITCSGESSGYSFLIRANTSGSRVVGTIVATVSGGSIGRQTVALQPVASAIKPGSYIQFSGQGSSFSGAVNTRYNRASGLYTGTINVQAGGAGGSGQVNCQLSGKGKFDFYDTEEADFLE